MLVRLVSVYLTDEADSFTNGVRTPTILSASSQTPKVGISFHIEDATVLIPEVLEGSDRDGSNGVLVKG